MFACKWKMSHAFIITIIENKEGKGPEKDQEKRYYYNSSSSSAALSSHGGIGQSQVHYKSSYPLRVFIILSSFYQCYSYPFPSLFTMYQTLEVFLAERKEVGNSAPFWVWLHHIIGPFRRLLPTRDGWLVLLIVTVLSLVS
jgi:hypothetical protein